MMDLEAIRRANPLPVVAGKLVALKPGGAEWLGRCPFHSDRSPSFTIFDQGQRFHCFGCGATGDVLDFVGRAYGVPLPEAARILGGGHVPKLAIRKRTTGAGSLHRASRTQPAALAIWAQAVPAAGTLAEAYLRFRGLVLPYPPALRFLTLPCGDSQPLPCLVAGVQDVAGEVTGIQRIWLASEAPGSPSRIAPPLIVPSDSLGLARSAFPRPAHADVETLGGNRPLSLYCLTIAASGERKSSCDAPLMEAMREFEREQAQAHSDARKAWTLDHEIWKKKHEGVLTKIKGGKASRIDLEAIGPEPAAPPLPDRLVSEPTYEGLTKLFHLGHPSLGLFSDEGGQFLGGFAMSQDNRMKTLAALNDLWMGNPIKRTRQGDGAFTLYGRRLSLHLMVQPVVALSFMGDPLAGDTGFLPRCLICEPASTIGTRLHDAAGWDDRPLQAFAERLSDILYTGIAMDPETRELQPRVLPLSAEARTSLIAFSDTVERAQAPGGEFELVRGYASKAAEQAARIAGVLSLWADMGTQAVQPEGMRWGIQLASFYLSEAKRLANAATVSVEVSRAEALRKWMQSPSWGKPWLTLRDVIRLGPSRLRENPEARKALSLLEENGWLAPMPEGTKIEGKVTRKAWRIVA
jgi:hypothetical protein